MANKGRTYAEGLVGPLDRSAYNQQREVTKNTYSTNWENLQNQYRNLQDKLKLQQQRANTEFAQGLVDVASNSFNRERLGSGELANRGLSASGLTNLLNQADTAQKGEDVGKLLKQAANVSTETADKLSQGTTKFADEGTGLMGKLANALGDIGDAETAMQNRYNQTLANIAGAMDEREMNNALQAAQRELQRASMRSSSASSGRSKELKTLQGQLEDFYKKAGIAEVLGSSDLTDQQKANYLGIMFGVNNANQVVQANNRNITAYNDYKQNLQDLKKAAANEANQLKYATIYNPNRYTPSEYVGNMNTVLKAGPNAKQNELDRLQRQGVTYEDLAALLYGTR